MTSGITIIGLGPGAADLLAPRAAAALARATDLLGYGPYLQRVVPHPGQRLHPTDNREELARARHALTLAQGGARVAVVSSGDPGVFAMAGAVFEAIDHGDPAWRALPIEVIPGISALLAAAARVGAPLGHDFCAMSLSDNLKPWTTIRDRLRATAAAGFVLALYNPISRERPWQLGDAFDLLRTLLPGDTPTVFATAISRADEAVRIAPLAQARPDWADMRTLLIVGSAETRLIQRPLGDPFVYTPRSMRPA